MAQGEKNKRGEIDRNSLSKVITASTESIFALANIYSLTHAKTHKHTHIHSLSDTRKHKYTQANTHTHKRARIRHALKTLLARK